MANKSIKREWSLSDADIICMSITSGSSNTKDDALVALEYKGVTALCKKVSPSTLDFFSCWLLLNKLYAKNSYYVGTVMIT